MPNEIVPSVSSVSEPVPVLNSDLRKSALLLFNGPKVPSGFPTLAIELDFVLTEERETVRRIIAKKLIQARRDFRRRPS